MKRYNVFDANNLYLGYVIEKNHERALKAAQKSYERAYTVTLSNLSKRTYSGE